MICMCLCSHTFTIITRKCDLETQPHPNENSGCATGESSQYHTL